MGEWRRLSLVAVATVACGGSESSAPIDASPGVDTSPPGDVCGDGIVSGSETCDDSLGGSCCVDCQLVAFGNPCRAATGECDALEVCDGLTADCPADASVQNGTACSLGFCASGVCAACDPAIDGDFDGFNQCDDCNDNSGLVSPGRVETCDGVDEDCDRGIDENFDADLDTFSVCSTDPFLFDCDDQLASVNPAAPEACGGSGTGNAIDDNCNGFVDETCQPCDAIDDDGDGASECDGDCDDASRAISPGRAEACDGVDTDCNRFTVQNCDVSDSCNFTGDADVCRDDLACGCVVGPSGACTGDFRCASFCEGSFTGPIGAGCTATQSCLYRWTLSDNQHACAETTAPLGSLLGGSLCSSNEQCRSGTCDSLCVGPDCAATRCVDFCDHHDPGGPGSCVSGTVCEIAASTFGGAFMFATCRLDDNGTATTGQACAAGCRWGPRSCVNGICAQPCGEDDHCAAGFHCSLSGNQVGVGSWASGVPPQVEGEPAIETVPVCLADSGAGAHDRPAGAVCTQNGDCQSQFCEASLGVCVDLCITDASCPPGLTCEPVFVRIPSGPGNGIVWSRVCTSASIAGFIESI